MKRRNPQRSFSREICTVPSILGAIELKTWNRLLKYLGKLVKTFLSKFVEESFWI